IAEAGTPVDRSVTGDLPAPRRRGGLVPFEGGEVARGHRPASVAARGDQLPRSDVAVGRHVMAPQALGPLLECEGAGRGVVRPRGHLASSPDAATASLVTVGTRARIENTS